MNKENRESLDSLVREYHTYLVAAKSESSAVLLNRPFFLKDIFEKSAAGCFLSSFIYGFSALLISCCYEFAPWNLVIPPLISILNGKLIYDENRLECRSW